MNDSLLCLLPFIESHEQKKELHTVDIAEGYRSDVHIRES